MILEQVMILKEVAVTQPERLASRINYLGQQDAQRKHRPPSKSPGCHMLAREVGQGEGNPILEILGGSGRGSIDALLQDT